MEIKPPGSGKPNFKPTDDTQKISKTTDKAFSLERPQTDPLQSASLTEKAQQDVLRPDVVVLEGARLFLGQHDHLPRALGEPFEHRDSPSCSPDPGDAKIAPTVHDGRWRVRDVEGQEPWTPIRTSVPAGRKNDSAGHPADPNSSTEVPLGPFIGGRG
jgi:hypothetical protein